MLFNVYNFLETFLAKSKTDNLDIERKRRGLDKIEICQISCGKTKYLVSKDTTFISAIYQAEGKTFLYISILLSEIIGMGSSSRSLTGCLNFS